MQTHGGLLMRHFGVCRGLGKTTFALMMCIAAPVAVGAATFDEMGPLSMTQTLSFSLARAPFTKVQEDCAVLPVVNPVNLLEVVEHALCNNPKTRQALADVKSKVAGLGSAKSAYWPLMSASMRRAKELSETSIPSAPDLSTHNWSSYRDYTLSLSWKLIDLGGRSGQVEYAKQLLVAAQEAQNDSLQTIMLNTVKDYYQACAAQTGLQAAQETEDDALRSLKGAQTRYRLGIAAVIDEMQAQTNYAMAVLDRTKAAGDLKLILGKLAIDIGQSPSTSLEMPSEMGEPQLDFGLDVDIDELIEEAKRNSPKTRQASAQLAAALAKVRNIRSDGLPSLSLSGKIDRSNQPIVPSIGQQPLPASSSNRYLGLQLDVPLFDGFDRNYQVRNAQALVDGQEATVFDVQLQVAQEIWISYATLQQAVENLRNTNLLLDSAQKAQVAAEQRYQKGAGSILELLSAHSALASSRQRRVHSLAEWHTARLQLAINLGRLSLLSLRE